MARVKWISGLPAPLVCVVSALAVSAYLICLLKAEAQVSIAAAIAGGVAAVALLKIAGVLDPVLECVHRAGRLWAGLMLAMAVFLVLFFHDDHYVLFLLGTVFIYSTAVLGINVQLGYTGLINFAGASFFGVGGYTAALLMTDTGLTPVLAILAGGISASLVGCILLLPVLRTSGNYAALVTMAFALLFKVFLEVCPWFGGPQGVPVDPFSLFGFSFAEEPKLFGMECSFYLSYDFLAIVLLVAVFAFTTLLERSWLGLSLDAVREDETASACFGISIARWKIWAFTVGNFICGIAGAYYAMMLAYISPANFAFSDSLLFLSILLLGGLGSRWGVILAAAFMVMLPEKFQVIQEYRYLIYFGHRPAHDSLSSGRTPAPQAAYIHREGVMAHLLECTDLTMRFGGLVALNALEMHVDAGETVGLVGPNGSGKTTFFNVVTGIYRASAGRVVVDGRDITGASPQEVCRAGVTRTFQRSRLCPDLTVFDNIMVGNHTRLSLGFMHNIFRRKAFLAEYGACREEAAEKLEALNPGLGKKLDHPVSELSMLDRRRVEIVRALMPKPRLLLLDEPSAGMTLDETQSLMDEIISMNTGDDRPAIILIEHEMNVIHRVCQRVVVLNFGSKLCEGTYDEVTKDPTVAEAYLGREVTEDE